MSNTNSLIENFKQQSETTQVTNLSMLEWIEKTQKEHMDAILYLEKLKQQHLQYTKKEIHVPYETPRELHWGC